MDCSRKHAFVTGASSGIGRATALRLAREGFHVFATVRKQADADALQAEPLHGVGVGELSTLLMDTTIAEEVTAAAKLVDAHVGDRGLEVLVNNAGVGLFQPLEFLPIDKFRWHLGVNAVGPLQVTQALLPMLRRSAGRIVIIGSIAGWWTMPFGGSHAATKHALVALAEALRMELAPWGIDVVLVEPGSIRSAAFDKLEAENEVVLREMGAEGRELYGEAYGRMMDKSIAEGKKGSPPDVVADVVLRAVQAAKPRTRYLAGRNARMSAWLVKLPTGVLDAVVRSMFGLPEPGSRVATRRPDETVRAAR